MKYGKSPNPFHFNKVVSKDSFCGRPEVINVRKLLVSGQNVALIGPRRTGKTSLGLEVCRRIRKRVIYADLMRARDCEDVVRRIAEAALRDGRRSGIEKFLKGIAHLRPALTVDPVTGGTQWTVTTGRGDNTTEGVVDILKRIHRRAEETGAVLFLDEFQDITELGGHEALLARMRSEIQRWSKVAVLYAGSDRDKMYELFTGANQPFYQSAVVVEVDTIERKSFLKYTATRFQEGGKDLPGETGEWVMQAAGDHPNSVQKLLYHLWFEVEEGQTAHMEDAKAALEAAVLMEVSEFERTFMNLTQMQSSVLEALASYEGEQYTGGKFLELTGIRSPSSVSKTLERLVEIGLLIRREGRYCFANPFYGHWLAKRF